MISRGTTTDPRQLGDGPGAAELLEDWITIWQSELAALLLDRETQDTMLRLVDGWAAQARSMLALLAPTGLRDAARPAGTDATARTAAPAAAPDERDAVVQQLLARVAELERRLAGARPDGPGV